MDWETEFKCGERVTQKIAAQFRRAARKKPLRVEYPDGGEGSYLGFELAYSLRKEQSQPYGWGIGANNGQVYGFTAKSEVGRCRVVCAATDRRLIEQEIARLLEAGWSHFIFSWK